MDLIESKQDPDFLLFIRKVKESTGIDLSQYKEAQMKRRLTTLRVKRGFDSFKDYYEAIAKDKALFAEFLDRMTINVSEFWRNPNRWEVLEKQFIPELKAKSGPRLKCWSAACSTGEEPYTLAMILAEQRMIPGAQITASDIDEGALAKAREGIYLDRSLREVPQHYLKKYFQAQGEHTFAISPSLKPYIRFEKKNLLTDRFDSGFDLIICRNVVIYFTDEAKHELYSKFSRALRPGGILFVGSTEQIFSPSQYDFEPADTFFYRKKGGV